MRNKWYVEFPAVITLLILAMLIGWNLSLPTCNKAKKGNSNNSKSTVKTETNPQWLEGRDIFKSNCAGCHSPKAEGVGPPLQGAVKRWRAAGTYKGKTGEQWMKTWIRNWHDVVDADYKYGVNMKNSRPAQMNIFVGMTDEKIDEIFLYVESPDGLNAPKTAQK